LLIKLIQLILIMVINMDIQTFFEQNNKVAIAFSGGLDSTYLLFEAVDAGCDVHAFFVKSAFNPDWQLEQAEKLAQLFLVNMTVIYSDVMYNEDIIKNKEDRCYHCKSEMFYNIKRAAEQAGYDVVIDGTNASDDGSDRPGMRAAEELGIISPLKICGITKDEVIKRSKEFNLPTQDDISYSCLATRIPSPTKITTNALEKIELAENKLHFMGFKDYRVRFHGNLARIEIAENEYDELIKRKVEVSEALKEYFKYVTVDLIGR